MNAHVAVKFIYVRLCKGSGAMHAKSASARSLWASICGVLWLASWVVSESIPGFNDILGLASSLFASWFSFAIPAIFWLFLNRGSWFEDWKQTLHFSVTMLVLAVAYFVVGFFRIPFMLCLQTVASREAVRVWSLFICQVHSPPSEGWRWRWCVFMCKQRLVSWYAC